MFTAPASSPALPTLRPAQAEIQPDVDERQLLERLLADDESAWREFNTRYSRLIYRCITRVTARFGTVVGAEDVREVYAMLCVQLLANDKRKLRSFEPGRGTKLSSWLGMLAIHTTYDHLRRVKREVRRATVGEAECLPSDQMDPFEILAVREQAALVEEMLRDFSSKDRQFITLYYGEGLDPVQVAARMDISVKTVYSKKHKIRARLEAILGQRRLAA